jgi:hypothetical protein
LLQVKARTTVRTVRERIHGELTTPDGTWRVQAVEQRRGHNWYRLISPSGVEDGLSIATVHRKLAEAGIDLADLEPVLPAA